ncbi:hypothetical protein ANRL1_04830 [Anaerolineae bacterium]|nr:hypothetical protein ANRL1_04830 [Anaerolineae bacterium]
MKIYDLMRADDTTGISGTGRVAQIVEFESGKVAVAWCADGRPQSVAVYNNLDEAKIVHGHSGSKFVLVLDTTQIREVGLVQELFEVRELFREAVSKIASGEKKYFGNWIGHCPSVPVQTVERYYSIIDGWV